MADAEPRELTPWRTFDGSHPVDADFHPDPKVVNPPVEVVVELEPEIIPSPPTDIVKSEKPKVVAPD